MLRFAGCDHGAVARLVHGYGLDLRLVEPDAEIPGSYWGESEAGLQGNTLLARHDTPIHSILHEAAHYICMTPERRVGLDRDAGGDDAEEHAVCYLQVLLAAQLRGFGLEGAWRDMDEWGYSFRLGSTRAWFEQDAQPARDWLCEHGIIDTEGTLTRQLRSA
jgi:hypothetical protein